MIDINIMGYQKRGFLCTKHNINLIPEMDVLYDCVNTSVSRPTMPSVFAKIRQFYYMKKCSSGSKEGSYTERRREGRHSSVTEDRVWRK